MIFIKLEPFDAYENWERKISNDKRSNNKFTIGYFILIYLSLKT